MNYITTAEAAKKWGLSSRRVLNLAREGRIPYVSQIGTRWMIPENAKKPADFRTRKGRETGIEDPDFFRFPSFEFRDPLSFDPPLNSEELVIKAATEAFYACRFKQADRILDKLEDRAHDRYIRISALHIGCMTDIFLCHPKRFLKRYEHLILALTGDFPHKAEMMEYIHSIDATLGTENYYAHEFQMQSDYAYHESFLPRLANLSALYLSFAQGEPTAREVNAYELHCFFLEKSEAFSDLVPLHLYLGIAWGELGNIEKQNYHIRKALALAEKYEIYYSLADQYYYMQNLFQPVITEFSEDFRVRLETLSKEAHMRFVRFMDTISMNNIYRMLASGDYIFVHYALINLPNKEIAQRLQIPAVEVNRRYRELLSRLGLKSKIALVKLYRNPSGKKNTGVVEAEETGEVNEEETEEAKDEEAGEMREEEAGDMEAEETSEAKDEETGNAEV